MSYDDDLGFPARAQFDAISFITPAFRTFSRVEDVAEPFVLLQYVNHCGFGMPDPRNLNVCPDYSIALWGDGTVAYVGRTGVRTLGRREHNVSQDAVRSVVQAISASGFQSMADDYSSIPVSGERVTTIDHAAERWLTIRLNGQQKTVHDFYGAPEALPRLEAAIETATDSQRYTGRKPGTRSDMKRNEEHEEKPSCPSRPS